MALAIFPCNNEAIGALTVGCEDAETGRVPLAAGGVR
jgi:hypothetical protein